MDQETLSMEHQAVQIYDRGLRSLAWRSRHPQTDDVFDGLSLEDLRKIIAGPKPKKAIQALPAQTIYRSLKINGVESCLEVLPFLSQEQFTRLIDYDAWQADEFVLERAMAWVALYGQVDPSGKQFFNRFKDLDEEYQLSMLMGLVQVIDLETYEDMAQHLQDEYVALPGQEMWYRILAKEDSAKEFIRALIDVGMQYDLKYTFSVLLHASYMPPNESQHDLDRIRKAHMEEDGFISYQESLSTFMPIDVGPLFEKYHASQSSASVVVADEGQLDFWGKVVNFLQNDEPSEVDNVRLKLIFLANNLCAAAQIEPDQMQEMQDLLRQVRAITSFGLEYTTGTNVLEAVKALKNEHPKDIFRVGLSLISGLTHILLEDLSATGLDFVRVKSAVNLGQWGRAQMVLDRDFLDVFGDEKVSFLKGLTNRFPMLLCEKEKNQFRYIPIESRFVFRALAEKCAALAATTQLCARLPGSMDSISEFQVDKALSTAMIHLVLGDLASAKPLNAEQINAFYTMDETAVKNQLNFSADQLLLQVPMEDFGLRYSIDAKVNTENVRAAILQDLLGLAGQIYTLRIRKQTEDAREFFNVD